MNDSSSKIFDDLGRLMNEAASVADGVRREVETGVKSQAERIINELDLVKREDFEVLKDIVLKQEAEIKQLRSELQALKKAKK